MKYIYSIIFLLHVVNIKLQKCIMIDINLTCSTTNHCLLSTNRGENQCLVENSPLFPFIGNSFVLLSFHFFRDLFCKSREGNNTKLREDESALISLYRT